MRIIRQIALSPDGVDMDYMGDGDIRADGAVYQSHHISISRGQELDDEIREFEEAADALLQAAINLWARTLPVQLTGQPVPVLDDDDEGD